MERAAPLTGRRARLGSRQIRFGLTGTRNRTKLGERPLEHLHSDGQRSKHKTISSLFDYLCERNAVLGNPVMASSARLPIKVKAAPVPLETRSINDGVPI